MAKSALLNLVVPDHRKVIYHEEDGRNYVETRQNVDHIIRAAEELFDSRRASEFQRVALIPDAVFDRAANEGWLNDPKAWRKWANDPANECFRTWKGTL